MKNEVESVSSFFGAELFLDMLLEQSLRSEHVSIRNYSQGSWQQLSGRDFVAHLGRAVSYWSQEFPIENRIHGQSVILLVRNSYSGFIASLAGLLAGFNVMCAPIQISQFDLINYAKYFNAVAIAIDFENGLDYLKALSLPVLNISKVLLTPRDEHPEPPILSLYRQKKKMPETQNYFVGHFYFVSFSQDEEQQSEILNIDVLIQIAQYFLLHVQIPRQIFLKSIEILQPSHPFAHLSRFVTLLRHGIIGFPNRDTQWEVNLKILRPTFVFVSPKELDPICSFIKETSERISIHHHLKVTNAIDKLQKQLSTSRAMKIPESAFDTVKRSLRFTSRFILGREFVKDAINDLRFVVHGLSAAQENHMRILEKLGVPLIESYGTTHAGGMLSCNTFAAPHFNVIGSPLPHVNFKIGSQSTLEYRISSPLFNNTDHWKETGDVIQMTPFGFIITGRKKHLIVTLGGAIVAPIRLEKLLKEDTAIVDACIIGDKMHYLSVLLVLNNEFEADYQQDPEKVREHVNEIISRINENLPRNVTIKKFHILDKAFSEINGEKLSNGEINRLRIQETYAKLIASLY